MGMRDESWCNGCGTSVPYKDEDEQYCGECAQEYAEKSPQKLVEMIAYMELHLVSLEQDLEKNFGQYTPEDNPEYMEYIASIDTTAHLLSVAKDILNK